MRMPEGQLQSREGSRHQWRDHADPGRHREPQCRDSLAGGGEPSGLNVVDQLRRELYEPLPGWGETEEPTRVPLDQRHAECPFEALDPLGQGRDRDAEALGGTSEVPR
jgi:hypothetical protein